MEDSVPLQFGKVTELAEDEDSRKMEIEPLIIASPITTRKTTLLAVPKNAVFHLCISGPCEFTVPDFSRL